MTPLTMNPGITSLAARGLRATPLAHALDTFLDKALRADVIAGVQFTDPPGDRGWFGPDSAIWYVHSHLCVGLAGSAVILQLVAGSSSRPWLVRQVNPDRRL